MYVKTPLMVKKDLYVTSDHWEHYREGVFALGDGGKDDKVLALRPTACPFQYYIYKQNQKSYRDLPCKYGETSTLFRNEDSGRMHGLTRVRQFTTPEGRLVVRSDQLKGESRGRVDLAKYRLTTFGLEGDMMYRMPEWDPNNAEHCLGTAEMWGEVQGMMRRMLDHIGIQHTGEEGETMFYGPELDIQMKNIYGKEDTMTIIQLDMFLTKRSDMPYVDRDGTEKHPYIIHRMSMGCYERTLVWMIEKYEGAFPTWLCPEQARAPPTSEKYHEYAEKAEKELKGDGILTMADERSERIDYRIREARLQKTPYMLVMGQKEEEGGVVSVRSRFNEDEDQKSSEQLTNDICKEVQTEETKKAVVIDQWRCGWKSCSKADNGTVAQSIKNEMKKNHRRSESRNAVAMARLFAGQSDR